MKKTLVWSLEAEWNRRPFCVGESACAKTLGQEKSHSHLRNARKISKAGTERERKGDVCAGDLQKLIDRCQVKQDLIGQRKTFGLCLQRNMKEEDFRYVCVHVVTQTEVSFVYLFITVLGICCCTRFL